MKTRFAELLIALKMNNSEMAESLSLTKAAVSDILHGRVKKLSGPVVELLKIKYKVNPDWLLTGEGAMFLDRKTSNRYEEARPPGNVRESITDLLHDPQIQRLIELLADQREQISVLTAYLSGTATIKELVATLEALPENKRRVALMQIKALEGC
jgi:transcriptional regulator with XRE-family HTH domain